MFSIFIIVFSFLFAIIEIEVEGRDGWAKNLPTPHLTSNEKSLTFYHVYIFLFVFAAFNMIFFIRTQLLNWRNVFYIFSMTLMFFFLEDMYWFFANPFHSILKQNEWHLYVGPIPLLYIVLPIAAFIVAAIAGYTKTFGRSFLVFFIGSIFIYLISIGYRKYYIHTHQEYIKTLHRTGSSVDIEITDENENNTY